MERYKDVFLCLGSNMGDRAEYLRRARKLIAGRIGLILQESSVYETEPWGMHEAAPFLNQVIEVISDLALRELHVSVQEIEKDIGRIRGPGSAIQVPHPTSHVSRPTSHVSRCIDIDILFCGEKIIDTPELVVPHPLIGERRFVLVPLAEIAGGVVHPVLNRTIGDLLLRCNDSRKVKKWNA
ncbi:MAG: 2-amino-4-hydroxy-6-hydroxymethyldihydropteridine diphosphokinase [bacterium]